MAYGSITQRGDKYRVCFDYGIDREGNRVRKYRTFDTKRDATRAFNEHKVKMDKGTQIMPSEYTFAQWLDYWYKDIILPQIEETTAYGYRGMIENYLKPQLGEIRLQKLTARDIQQYYTWLMGEKELSPNTVIKHHNLLTNTLNAAERQEYITKNPMRAVSPPKKRQREAKFYTPEQLGILLDKAVGTRLELPVFICAYLGLRRGELCGLRWSDVDLEHQTITIEHTRTQAGKKEIEKGTKTASSTRTLYLPDTLCDMLKAAKEREQECKTAYKNAYDDNDYVVVMEYGRPFRPNYLSELFGKFLADNDLPKIVLHEPLSEFLACQLAEQVCPAAVRYDLDFYYHKLISKCRLFTDEAHGLAKLSDFPDHPNSVSGLMKFYEKFGAEDVLWRIFVLDALILNTDRHPGNFGFLFDNQTMEVKTAAPMFDHNRSLLFDLDEDQLARPD